MKIAIPCVMFLLACGQLSAQGTLERTVGSGVEATEIRAVSEFDKVDLRGVGSVRIVVGQTFLVRVSADANTLPLITTEVAGGKLAIGMKDLVSISPKTKISVEIRMPKLTQLCLSGAGDLSASEFQSGPLEIELTGAGSVSAQGSVDGLSIDVNGTGNVDVSKLDVAEASVAIAGVGNVSVNAEKSLNVSISGVGNVRYAGSPNVSKSIDGIGSVGKNSKAKSG